MQKLLVFDIETIPDLNYARQHLPWRDQTQAIKFSNSDIAKAIYSYSRANTGSDFLKHYLHQIVEISCVMRSDSGLKIWSLGRNLSANESREKQLISRFFAGIDKYQPTLVSYNGQAFDLPVLHYRSLKHKVSAPTYWDIGELNKDYKWNNYTNRYHTRHIDLMDVLAAYQPRAYIKLEELALINNFPGKMGMDGSKVFDCYQNNELDAISNYCETDVLNTYLVYLKFELIRGKLNNSEYQQEIDTIKKYLIDSNLEHFAEFLDNWEKLDVPAVS